MKDLGFECLKSDADIFLFQKKNTSIVIAVIYVDDALFCGPTKDWMHLCVNGNAET